MKISVITAVFNNEATLAQCMESVQFQTHPDVEHVIIDGVSTDRTMEVAQTHLRESDVLLSEKDDGIYDALNKGVRHATGEIIAVLGSDDFYSSRDSMSAIAKCFADTEADAVYGDLVYVRGSSERIVRFWRSGEYHAGCVSRGWIPPHPAFFCRKSLFEKYGGFRLDMPVAADFEFMLRLIEKHRIKLAYLPQAVTTMRLGGTSNQIQGVISGNASIASAFQLNGIDIPRSYFLMKPFRKLRQYILPTWRAQKSLK